MVYHCRLLNLRNASTTSPTPTMLNSLKLCLSWQLKQANQLLEKLGCIRCWNRCKTEKPASNLSSFTSSFAAMEMSNQLDQVFKIIDTNGDGKLSPFELKQVLMSLGYDTTDATQEAQGMVRVMDFDGDGFVDFNEFMNVMKSDQEQDPGNGISWEQQIMEVFRVFDSDNNGLISPEELQSVLGRLGYYGKCSLEECRNMIKGVDRDGDGFVSFEEFKAMMKAGL